MPSALPNRQLLGTVFMKLGGARSSVVTNHGPAGVCMGHYNAILLNKADGKLHMVYTLLATVNLAKAERTV